MAHSMDAERGHAEITKWESSKLKHISTASRNAIIKRHLRWRQEQCDLLTSLQAEINKLTRTHVNALVWQQPHAARPAGKWFSSLRQPDQPATMAATSGSSLGQRDPPATRAATRGSSVRQRARPATVAATSGSSASAGRCGITAVEVERLRAKKVEELDASRLRLEKLKAAAAKL